MTQLKAFNPVARWRRLRERGLFRFGREAYAELRKAHWPTREQTIRLTAVVLAISATMAVLLGLADFGFGKLFELVAP